MAGLLGRLFGKSKNVPKNENLETLPAPAVGPTFGPKGLSNENAERMNTIQEMMISREGASPENQAWFRNTQKKYNMVPLDEKQWIQKHIAMLDSEILELEKGGPSLRLLDSWEMRNILRGRVSLPPLPIPPEVETTRAQLSIPRTGAGSPVLGNMEGFAPNVEGAAAPATPLAAPAPVVAPATPPPSFTVTTLGGRRRLRTTSRRKARTMKKRKGAYRAGKGKGKGKGSRKSNP
jgi:hypothetical protein